MKEVALLLLFTLLLFNISCNQTDNKQNEIAKVSTGKQVQQASENKHVSQNKTQQQVVETRQPQSWFSGITSQVVLVSIFFVLLFSILLLLFIYKLLKKERNLVSNATRNYVKRKIDEVTLNKQKFPRQEVRSFHDKIEYLESDIKRLNERINIFESSPKIKENLQQIQRTTQQPTTKPETFYLSTPNSDGSFNSSSSSASFREGASIYKFIKTENNKAKFQMDEKEASIKLAIQYPDKSIDPVCEAENNFNPQASKIITRNPGEAELQNGKWIVTKKAKISYEQ